MWSAEYDEWGNMLREDNPDNLQHRYITQDPIGLEGGLNLYAYPLNPVTDTDPLGLKVTFKGDEEQQKATKEAYEFVRKTKHGQKMIEKIESSEHDYIFRGPRKGMEHTCYDPSEYIFYIETDSDHASCLMPISRER